MKYYIKYVSDNEERFLESEENNDLRVEIYEGKRTTLKLFPKHEIKLLDTVIELDYQFSKNSKIFANGYQSWTDTKEFTVKEHLKDVTKLPKFVNNMFAFSSYGDAYFKKYDKNTIHAFDLGYVKDNIELFIGSYNYKNAYLIINFVPKSNKIYLESDLCGRVISSPFVAFDFVLVGNVEAGKDTYFSRLNCLKSEKIFGYTSWYNFYQDINEEKILTNLEAIDSRFNLFQIDDGFETFVGDWLDIDPNKFPNGLQPIVYKIHDKNLKAGIWLAPFVAEEKSDLFQNHKDLFARRADGSYYKVGCNWSGQYALDFYNPDTRAYIKKCFDYYLNMGFDFFKLDFLYGICVPERNDKTRAEISEDAYAFIRECLGDKLVLGCGAILSNSFEKFDYLRIGPDVSLIFDDVWYMKYMHRERISTKVTLQNTIYRGFLNGKVFGNDPDVFLLRDDNIKLSRDQKYALTQINALFGSVLMTSDDIGKYNYEKKELLEMAFELQKKATVTNVCREGKLIKIEYLMDGQQFEFRYNTKKGVIVNG